MFAHVYLGRGRATSIERRPFLAARVARLVPLYVLALILSAPFVLGWFLHANGLGVGLAKAASSLVVNLGFAGAWLPFAAGPWNPPGWSLSVEVVFYAAFPWVGPWLARQSGARLATIALGGHLATLAAALALGSALGAASWAPALLERSPLLHLHEFVLGVAAARAVQATRPGPTAALLAMIGGGVACAAVLLAWPAGASRLLLHDGVTGLGFAALIGGAAALRGAPSRLLGSKALVHLGDASYALYLLHIPLLFWFFLAHPQGPDALHASPAPLGQDALGTYALYWALILIRAGRTQPRGLSATTASRLERRSPSVARDSRAQPVAAAGHGIDDLRPSRTEQVGPAQPLGALAGIKRRARILGLVLVQLGRDAPGFRGHGVLIGPGQLDDERQRFGAPPTLLEQPDSPQLEQPSGAFIRRGRIGPL